MIYENLITEGGAAGHMMHLYDNPDLTFDEIKDVLSSAAEGRLERVTEKLDGINLVFTWDLSEGLKVARSGGDIKRGGMDAHSLAQKFRGRGNIEDAFTMGFSVLNKALMSLPAGAKKRIFGKAGDKWYSLELIYTAAQNTINYDSNNIVFHGWPVFVRQPNGEIEPTDDQAGVQFLEKHINAMQNAIAQTHWRIRGPALVRLKKLSNDEVLNKAISRIETVMGRAGMGDDDTLAEYMYAMAFEEAKDLHLSTPVAKAIASRLAKLPGAPSFTEIKKMVSDPEQLARINRLVKTEKILKGSWIAPLEYAIHDFAIEVLKGLESSIIGDSAAEVARLRATVSNAISKIEASGHEEAMAILNTQMQKLKSVENIASPMEGIVFIYKGNAYKFTGSFAPAHQIVSLFTFGRKGIKFETLENVGDLLTEGGHAFSKVGPITLEALKETWPYIDEDLSDLGLTDVRPIGTTWKKKLMGDIDLTASYDGERDELYEKAVSMFGADNVKKVGSNIVTLQYPVYHDDVSTGEFVQVDVMLGKPGYITWSRYGPSPEPTHSEYSPVKGLVRNILLNIVTRYVSEEEGLAQDNEWNVTRYVIDFDKGLYKVNKTRVGPFDPKTGVRRKLKSWKTVSREFITDEPDEIVEILFGAGVTSRDILTISGIVEVLKRSPIADQTGQIVNDLASSIEDLSRTSEGKRMFGSDENVQAILDYIDSLAP